MFYSKHLGEVLNHMYPTADTTKDFIVADFGEGVHIAAWNLPDPIPTVQEIQDKWIQILKESKVKELNAMCNQDISKGFVSASTGYQFEFETLDQTNMDQEHGRLMRRTEIQEVKWNTVGAGEVILTREQFFTVCDEAAMMKWNKVSRYRTLKEQVNLCTTEEEIIAITW
jgi:hypothetical protein